MTAVKVSSPALDINLSTKLISVVLEEPFKIYSGVTLNNFSGGAFSYIAPGVSLFNTRVGRYSSIGDNVSILSAHPVDRISTSPYLYQNLFPEPFVNNNQVHFVNVADTVIGNDVWIGSGVKIKSGVTIGDGSIIGAGSVVTKDIAPFSIVGGVPAKLIRMRFDRNVIEKILMMRWWDFNLSEIKIDWEDPIENVLEGLNKILLDSRINPYISEKYSIFKDGSEIKARKLNS
jgi:acetyltransferase-like isoleucine patch superfamily enzyme